jgi:lipopolysaccharide biosynthesis glycosyltransferase
MNICIIYSPNWLEYIYTEIYALVNTNPCVDTIYLISDDNGHPEHMFCNNIKQQYNVIIKFIDLEHMYNEKIHTPAAIGRFTKYTLYRLLLPYVIPEDRLLYIDADAIVNGDLSELYNMDIEDCHIAGCKDIGILDCQLQDIGMKPSDDYINAGVLLMNLKKIREDNLTDKWIDMINTRPTSCFDQDMINSTCKIKLVDNEYNSSISTGFAPIDEIKIAHYAGHLSEKGWCGLLSPMHNIWKYWSDRYDRK